MRNEYMSQWSHDFIQKMKNRIIVGWFRYGKKDNVVNFDNIKYAKERICMYENTHNQEFLVDAANMLMLEYQYPSFLDVFFGCDAREVVGNRKSFEKYLKGGK